MTGLSVAIRTQDLQ